MNPSDTQEQHSQFLEAMATQYSFTGDTRTVFLYRFDQANGGKDNTALARSIAWSRKPEDGAQKLQDELKKICDVLQQAGCSINQPTSKGRQPKGNSPWEQALKWLWETKNPEWQQRQNLGSINEYLALEIQPKPDETIFDEQEITFRDSYVPLKVRLLDGSGNPIQYEDPIDLEQWAKKTLNDNDTDRDKDKDKKKKILFIQGDAGRGKSVFCRMFADWVRENWHTRNNLQPSFTPIVIKLRYLKVLENSLTKTIENYLETYDFVKNPSWLTDKNNRFLFFLDGFDELLLEGRASGGIKEFLQQVEHFQQSSHHRFIVTGRPLALQGIDRLITQTKSLERAEIQLMDDNIRQTWLKKWAVKVGQEEANKFQQFLDSCPTEIEDNLAREPLLLYLLARMHREQYLSKQMFAKAEGIQAKILIYDKSVSWILEKQRQDKKNGKDQGENQNVRLTGLNKDDLRSCLTEAALCVVQSGNESAKVTMLVSRLKENNNPIAEAIQKARKEIKDEEKFFNNLLTSFYIKPASGDKEGSVEFCHKSFSEFLFAERLKESILEWTTTKPAKRQRQRQREDDLISTNEMNRQIYDLLGYGDLTREIVDYLMALLASDEEFKPVSLFKRLESFYECWCDGEFIDADPNNNLPQSKMQALKTQIPDRETQLGLRQVDMYAGLNIMILLLELHRYAQQRDDLKQEICFYPSGKPSAHVSTDTTQPLRLINYSNSVRLDNFHRVIGQFLSGANLTGANLSGTNLTGANLTGANLTGANLAGANLDRVNLTGANLDFANLDRADFTGASLDRADFTGASLDRADFTGANLDRAKGLSRNGLYQSIQIIYESANSAVYRAILKPDNQPVILKILRENYLNVTPLKLIQYKHEYKVIRSLNTDGVIKAYNLQRYKNSLVMFLEDFGGESLKLLMRAHQFTLKEFLSVAIKTTESLAAIHAGNIIHKDINPSNIIYNPETEQLKIIDFGLSTCLLPENQTVGNIDCLEGTLAYIAPEQTGRINRGIDYRSDFYSLGITFYELLTNKLPFVTTDALELVHCHIAQQPIPPHELVETLNSTSQPIPKAVSDIVMKLLAKTPEERYQSAWGIKADLEACRDHLETRV